MAGAAASRLRLPARFQPATIETVDIPEICEYAAVISVKAAQGLGVLLSGPPGTGKTWAAAALTRRYRDAVADTGGDYEFVSAADMFDNLTGRDSVDEYRDRSWRTTYGTVPWLAINDLGKEARFGYLAERVPFELGRVLRARSESRLPVVITTNLDGPGLKDAYGEAITSLLGEMTVPILVGGKDRRLS